MLFNSLPFALFLPLVFAIYWALGRPGYRVQNMFMILASYVFYGWWDWRFLFLIVISSLADFVLGLRMHAESSEGRRKTLLIASLVVNLGILGFFKYFNFFVDSAADLLALAGFQPNVTTLRIILPVGISFYTFQTLSYTLDIYRRQIEPTRDPFAFFAFVSFFPQLVAGPIERARDLLPQFLKPRTFDEARARDGLRQMLWGFFKKIVIADSMAPQVEEIYSNFTQYDSLAIAIGTFFFAIQIYCDFSGYSDIAIGSARLFGFNLRRNFAFPYFSRDIAEFWRRWHISLSTWFRDYVFIPLGGNRCGRGRQIFNIFVTFTVSGLWHGANWTFVVWGALNGLYYLPIMLRDKQKSHTDLPAEGRLLPAAGEFASILVTFVFTLLAWVFFRAESVGQAVAILGRVFSTAPSFTGLEAFGRSLALGAFVLLVEWFQRDKQHALECQAWPLPARWPAYAGLIAGILVLGNFGSTEFIYFQF
jgi:D-alanyl-lipoteichoic acid acyltransferase DltB (MBOAT superfamily)